MNGTQRATAAQKRHLDRVAAMGCICCELMNREQSWPTEIHHIRCNGQARNHWLVLPLCGEDCHRGRNGVELERVYLRLLRMNEWDLLALVIQHLSVNYGSHA